MIEALHAWAVAPAALGTCCVAADRARLRAPELAASVLMTVGMLDAALTHVVPGIVWAAVFVAAAIGQAVWVRARRATPDEDRTMAVHAGIGLVAMAALLLLMDTGPALPAAAGHHAGAAGSGVAFVVVIAVSYGASSVWLARRGAPLERLQYLSMGAATVLMGLAALV